MTLAEYITAFHRGKTQAEIADELGVSRPFLSQIMSGKRAAGAEVLARIRIWSGGAVNVDTLLMPPDGKKSPTPTNT